MKWLKRSALGLVRARCGLALAAVAAVLWVVGTRERHGVARAAASSPPRRTISIERIRGSLLDGLRLEGVRMRTARDELDIDSLALEWNGPAAADRRARVHARRRGAVRRIAACPASRPAAAARRELPWPLRIEEGSVATLSITVADTHAAVHDHDLRGNLRRRPARAHATSRRRSATPPSPRTPRSSSTDGIELDVAGEWSGPLAGVAASGSVELTGTWPELAIRHELATPVRRDHDGHDRRGPVPLRPRQRVAEPRVARRRRHREPERPARARRARWPTIVTTAPARSTSWAARRASRSKARDSDCCSRSRGSSSCPTAPGSGTLRAVGSRRTSRAATTTPRRRGKRLRSRLARRGVAGTARRHGATARATRARAERRARCHRARRRAARLRRHDGRRCRSRRGATACGSTPCASTPAANRVVLTGALDQREARPHASMPSSTSSICSCPTSTAR